MFRGTGKGVYLADDILVREAHNKTVLGGIVLVLVLGNKAASQEEG